MADQIDDRFLIGLESAERYFDGALLELLGDIQEFESQGQVGRPTEFADRMIAIEGAARAVSALLQKERKSLRGEAVLNKRKADALRKEAAAAVASHDETPVTIRREPIKPDFE